MNKNDTRTDNSDWHNACQNAVNDFANFRTSPEFQKIIEGTPVSWGEYHLVDLIENPNFRSIVEDLDMMDLLGLNFRNNVYKKVISFHLNDKSGIKKKYHLTPTALRYARNSFNLIKFFGKNALNFIDVYEIGGGYGGDLKTFECVSKKLGIQINSWNIYDLESSKDLLSMSCKSVKTKVNYIFNNPSSPISNKNKSLFFSCGAISEMNGKTLENYLENVVLKCDYGYCLSNFDSHSKPYNGISTDDFINFLKNNGKRNVQEVCPFEFFTPFDAYIGGSRLVIFG